MEGWIITVGGKILDLVKALLVRKKPSDAMIDAINVRLLSEELIESPHLSADCFFIFMVHDHGGKLRPDNFMFWSIIDGAFNEVLLPKFSYKNYQLMNAELEFLQLARLVHDKKQVAIRVSEMPKSNLRTSFEYENLKYLRFFYLKQDRRAMWFIMVGTTAENESLDDVEHEGKIFIAVNQVKNIIRGY